MKSAIITDVKTSPGGVIRALRNDKGLTVGELAEKSGTSASGVSRWENGSRVPNIDVFVRIVQALGADVVVIKTRRGEDHAPASKGGTNGK